MITSLSSEGEKRTLYKSCRGFIFIII